MVGAQSVLLSLAQYGTVLVSGPHRSGTTIASEIISAETGLRLVREEDFGLSNEARLRAILAEGGVVVQAPFFSHALHYLPCECVVMMMRSPDAIRASEARMRTEAGAKTGGGIPRYRARAYHATGGPELVYENWHEQKQRIEHWIELDYEILKGHRLWRHERGHFHYRQTG